MKEDKSKSDPILDQVLEFSRVKGLFDCGTVVVGLSGGPDSVALLCILKALKERKDIDCDIRAFHCNHHLRPEVCDEEAAQVKTLCESLGIELKVIDFDCAGFAKLNRISDETAGRLLRYEAFEQYAAAIEKATSKKVRIAIAHHKDDIAETMMMNLFRGSGLEGLVNPKSITGRIIRPLLCLNKSVLVGYLESRGIKYAVDQTNLSTDGTRNTWRNDILPKIGGYYNEDPAVPLARTYKLLSDDLDFISDAAGKAYVSGRSSLSGHPVLSVKEIKDLHMALKSRVIRLLWYETFGDLIDFEETHLSDCSSMLNRDTSGELILDMPFGRKAYRHEDVFGFAESGKTEELAAKIAENMGFLVSDGPLKLELKPEDIPNDGEIVLRIPNSALKLRVSRFENKGELEYNYLLWFCPVEAIREGGLTAGNYAGSGSGLRMRRAGSSGSKELNRLMTDLKIPESARKQIIFFEKDGEILWLPGFGHGVGFTDAVSREKYIAARAEADGPDELLKIAIERQ